MTASLVSTCMAKLDLGVWAPRPREVAPGSVMKLFSFQPYKDLSLYDANRLPLVQTSLVAKLNHSACGLTSLLVLLYRKDGRVALSPLVLLDEFSCFFCCSVQ